MCLIVIEHCIVVPAIENTYRLAHSDCETLRMQVTDNLLSLKKVINVSMIFFFSYKSVLYCKHQRRFE